MEKFTVDQKVAMLVVPMLLFGMIGISYASAYGRNLTEDEESAIRKAHTLRESGDYAGAEGVLRSSGIEQLLTAKEREAGKMFQTHAPTKLEQSIIEKNHSMFVESLTGTAFE